MNEHPTAPAPAQGPSAPPAGEAEPTFGTAPVPMWLVGLLGLLLYWACTYADNHGGMFNTLVYEPYLSTNQLAEFLPKSDADMAFALGKRLFDQNCAPCHQGTGMGEAGKAPPLAGSEWVLATGPNRIIHIVLHGLSGPVQVKGQEWNLAMLSWKDILTDQQIAATLTYVRNSWGNKAAPVTPDEVKKIRAATQDRAVNMTAEELLKLPEKE